MTTPPGTLTPRQALDKAMLNIAEAIPELTEKELHVTRIKAGFHYPEFQDAIIEWLVEYCDQHGLESNFDSDGPWLSQMRIQIHCALMHILDDDEEAQRLGLHIIGEFTRLREALFAQLKEQEEARKHEREERKQRRLRQKDQE